MGTNSPMGVPSVTPASASTRTVERSGKVSSQATYRMLSVLVDGPTFLMRILQMRAQSKEAKRVSTQATYRTISVRSRGWANACRMWRVRVHQKIARRTRKLPLSVPERMVTWSFSCRCVRDKGPGGLGKMVNIARRSAKPAARAPKDSRTESDKPPAPLSHSATS